MLETGAIILGKYRVERMLGKGGMGVVARAHHLELNQPVAIKLLLPDALGNEAMVKRFRREARAMVQLKSEHVSKVFDVGTLENGSPYMVMEYLEGKDLRRCLREQGRLEPGFAVDMVLQACEALAEAHAAGIVHRDIKPANFFLTTGPDGEPLLKVLDFGIAKASEGIGDDFTTSLALMGTPSYMSPEQMHSAKHVDARTDIWALGVVLYELVSGRRPFRGDGYPGLCLAVTSAPPAPLDDIDLPPGLGEAIIRCLAKEPSSRFGDVGELAAALSPYAATTAQGERSSQRAARILSRAESVDEETVTVAGGSSDAPTVASRPRARSAEPWGRVDTATGTVPTAPTVTRTAAGAEVRAAADPDTATGGGAAVDVTPARARSGPRYLLVASIAFGVGLGLAVVLLTGYGRARPNDGGEVEGGDVSAPAPPAASPHAGAVPTEGPVGRIPVDAGEGEGLTASAAPPDASPANTAPVEVDEPPQPPAATQATSAQRSSPGEAGVRSRPRAGATDKGADTNRKPRRRPAPKRDEPKKPDPFAEWQ
ncbi:protein kinase domain-containing protein [Haliangium sp.]|uniref:serine/threonine-protein kinase n=1 Tax=Haliangium sp. TaxID=2663208 RepID=UPI003D0EC1B7